MAGRYHTRNVQGGMEEVGVVEVPDCDQNGGADMEAEQYGSELGVEGDLHITKGKGSGNGVSEFEETLQEIDEAIQYDHRSPNSNEANINILLVQEGSKASRELELSTQVLGAMGTLDSGTPCITSNVKLNFNMREGSNVVAVGECKGKYKVENNLKGTLCTRGRPRNKKGEHARVVLKTPGRGRRLKVGDRSSILRGEIVSNVECGTKRKGRVGFLLADTEEGKEKRLKGDEEVCSPSVTLTSYLGLAEVVGQPRWDQGVFLAETVGGLGTSGQ